VAGFSKRARAVRLAIFDVDGVFTDGTLWLGMDGKEQLKAFNILDGHGVKMLQAGGVRTAIITGRSSAAVAKRGRELGIGDVIQGAGDKVKAFEGLLRKHGLEAAECAYMGDDLPDLAVMKRCGLAVAPANAAAAVKREAHLVTRAAGGRGAVRELCERLLVAVGRGDIVSGELPVK
jgi:3-deoxy-D-manno-octulosonate 8-phosphate phosphatase (KDO 8-P phosphatase)